ncbi:hypothetical protein FB451DRAFT_1169309 [Mycena latifolia]|nr:hypothetical protein FB451DRAFT_1169309 [Mycena latifolia]
MLLHLARLPINRESSRRAGTGVVDDAVQRKSEILGGHISGSSKPSKRAVLSSKFTERSIYRAELLSKWRAAQRGASLQKAESAEPSMLNTARRTKLEQIRIRTPHSALAVYPQTPVRPSVKRTVAQILEFEFGFGRGLGLGSAFDAPTSPTANTCRQRDHADVVMVPAASHKKPRESIRSPAIEPKHQGTIATTAQARW